MATKEYRTVQKKPVFRQVLERLPDNSVRIVCSSSPKPNLKRRATTRAPLDMTRKYSRNDSLSSDEEDRGTIADASSSLDSLDDSGDEGNRTVRADKSLLNAETSRREKDRKKKTGGRRARDHAPSISEANRTGPITSFNNSQLPNLTVNTQSASGSASGNTSVSASAPQSSSGNLGEKDKAPSVIQLDENEEDEPITKGFLVKALNIHSTDLNEKFDKKYSKLKRHTKKHRSEIDDLRERLEKLEAREKEMPKMIEDKAKEIVDARMSEAFENKLRTEIQEHRKKLMFFNVPAILPVDARKWVRELITKRTGLKPHQVTGLKFMKVMDLDKSHDNLKYDSTHVEVTFANEDLKIVIFQKLLNDKVLANRTDKLVVTDSIPKTYRSKAQYFDMKLKDYRDTMSAATAIRIQGVQLQAWWAGDGKNWVLQHWWTPKERVFNVDKDRDRRPKPRTTKVPGSGQGGDGMDVDEQVVTLPPSTALNDEQLNELGHAIIVKLNIDMKDPNAIDHYGKHMATVLTSAKIKHKIILAKAKCFTVIFESKEDRKIGFEYIIKHKPFDEYNYARLTKH